MKKLLDNIKDYPTRALNAALNNPWPLVVFLLALTLRSLYQISLADDPFFHYLNNIPDAFLFHNWASEIASENRWWGEEVFFIGPLYAYFLAVIYKIFGPNPDAVRLIQAVLDSFSAVFIYLIARRISGSKVGAIAAGLAWALYLPALFFEAMLLPAALIIFLTTGGLALALTGLGEKGNWKHLTGAGLLIGLASLGRPNLALFAVLAAIPLLFIKSAGWRKAAAFFVPVLLLIGLTMARNAAVGGDFVPISYQGGINFYIGNSKDATGVYNTPEEMRGRPKELNKEMATEIAQDKTSKKLKPSQVSKWWFERGVRYITENPGEAAKLYWAKLRLLCNDFEPSLNVDYYFMKFLTPFHKVIPPWFGLVLALGIPGAIVALIERKNNSWFLALYLGLYALSILLFFVTSVYRLPLAPVLIVFAAYGVVKFVGCIRDKVWLHVILYPAMAIAIFLFAIWIPAGASKEAGFGQSYFRYGKYYFEQGEFRQAITYFNKSIAARPDNSRALLMLGISYQLEGMEREALDSFGQALVADPESPQANYYFGLSLFNSGEYEGAVGYLERSAQLAPDNPDTWDKLGAVYVRGNDYNGARLAYSRLVELQPDSPAAHQRLAEVLMQLGYAGEAVNESIVALKLNPGQAGANLLLGRYYWGTGELQLAEEHLLREIENSPEFLPAYFFIADFYMDTGRPENALRYYIIYRENGGQPDEKLEILLQ